MSSIPGFQTSITGASGTQGLLGPKSSYRVYVLPRGGHAAQSSTGTLITFDSADVASRFAANQWVQVGLNTANIRQVSGVGGNSITVSGAALTVAENDRVFLIGSTQPTVSGGSATYTVPATVIRQRDDDAAAIYTNSMVTSTSDGLVQFWSSPNTYDCIIQDGNQSNVGQIIDLEVGTSQTTVSVFGATVTINAALGVTGWATFGSSVTMHANLGVSGSVVIGGSLTTDGWARFGSTVTCAANVGVTGSMTIGQTLTSSGGTFSIPTWPILGGSLTITGGLGVTGTLQSGAATVSGGISVSSGLSVSTGIFGVSQQPRVWLYSTAAGITTTQGGSQAIPFEGEHYDIGGLHTGTTSRVTIPTGYGGVYLISGRVVWNEASASVGVTISLYVNKNGTITLGEGHRRTVGSSSVDSIQVSCVENLNAGDFVESVIYNAYSLGTLTLVGSTASKTSLTAAKLF